jgi:hypothetical protein
MALLVPSIPALGQDDGEGVLIVASPQANVGQREVWDRVKTNHGFSKPL